ncbi:MAG: hypothetical protein JWN94_3245 [Betaproteobacteria bacterium]|nr:hypothetical protein [Betaproteobacteria bacterium]
MNIKSVLQRMFSTSLLFASAFLSAANAAPVSGQGTWETTLVARDINGDGNVDAFYDTVLNVTWLANANAGAGSTFDNGLSPTDGRMTWANANAWVAALNVLGVTGWRLPEMFPSSTTSSELSHMYYSTLGNFGPGNPLTTTGPGTWGFTNTGPFTNLVSEFYWTGTPAGAGLAWVWAGDPISAYHSAEPVTSSNRAWAVHSGNVLAVPEPGPSAMLFAGLGLLLLGARRQD